MAKQKSQNSKITLNYFIVTFCFGLLALLIMYKVVQISFVQGNRWRELGEEQIRPNVQLPAMRGNILSADHELMATTEYRYRLYMDFWAEGLQIDTLQKYIGDLSVELNKLFPEKPASYYRNHIMKGWEAKQREADRIACGEKTAKRSREYRILADKDVNYLQVKKIRSMPFFRKGANRSGLYTKKMVNRVKPFGSLASRTIGDIYKEAQKGGMNGLELHYEDILKGVNGTSTRKKVNGRWINVPDVRPINGSDVVSSIDIRVQDIVEKALSQKVQDLDAESGVAVVMEVATGEIKAISNLGRVREGRWDEIKNYAVSDLSEPGSTFKVVSMMVALEDSLVRTSDIIETGNGLYHYGNAIIRDHNAHRGGYGTITADKSIRYSSNVGVAKIILKAYENNPARYVEGIYKIGIQNKLDLEIPGTAKPNIRHPKDSMRYWSKTTLPWMSFGYETQVPPIYTLTFFNAIANGGKMMKPLFTKEIQREGKTIEKTKPVVVNEKICSASTLSSIKQMLDEVVNAEDGTGKPAHSNLLRIAGKTGTAQLSQGSAGYRSGGASHQVSFCGYFPADDPKYSCIVVIRRPRNGPPSGGNMCGTVLKQIAEEMFAQNFIYKINTLPQDTIHPISPKVKNGLGEQSKYVLDKLKIRYTDSVDTQWMTARLEENNNIVVKNHEWKESLVPNVIGMGAKDAIYALENAGLQVRISGQGEVRSQSISPGTMIAKGQTIHLQLK